MIHSQVAFSPDGKFLFCGERSDDATLTAWNPDNADNIRAIAVGGDKALVYLAERKLLWSVSSPGLTFLHDIETGKLVASFQDEGEFSCAAVSPDGKLLVAVREKEADARKFVIHVWTLDKMYAGR